ncbi:MAG: PIN domain protein [Gammaproteobacteria bacterium]|nr:PIN domain protein [Gammaproteobacteria bacterium]NNJ84882.1 PIN domain protein [Gammaproteobacteria bacterium]
MRIYLDNCCFNRPFDDQLQSRIRLEAEAKLKVQEAIRSGVLKLIWSYMLDYENSKNPFHERQERIGTWRMYASADVQENERIHSIATRVNRHGIKKLDSLHIACAIGAGADYFLTTDDGILRKSSLINKVRITDPIEFIKEISI